MPANTTAITAIKSLERPITRKVYPCTAARCLHLRHQREHRDQDCRESTRGLAALPRCPSASPASVQTRLPAGIYVIYVYLYM